MSFILDALKKSESDRQRQSGPSLFEVKVAPPRRALPVWAVAIAVLLAINVVVISWMLLRHGEAQRPAAPKAPASAPAAQAADTGAATAAVSAPPEVRRASRPAGSAGPSGPARQPASAGGGAPSTAAASAPAAAAQAAPATVAGTGTAGPDVVAGHSDAEADPSDYAPAVPPAATQDSGGSPGALPLYRQVVATDGLPELHLDLHVYARNPKDRFVMINMHKLVEGASLPNGVHVDAIRPDGVVLSYHGTQFLLPRD